MPIFGDGDAFHKLAKEAIVDINTLAKKYPIRSRPVIMLAPDAVVMLNKNNTVPICHFCDAAADINNLITEIQISLNVNSVPGTASFTMSIPRHSANVFIDNGHSKIRTMSEVEIFIKGRFLSDKKEPLYYRCFWGLTTSVGYSYSDGSHTLHIECADMLKWWEITENETHSSAQSILAQDGKNIKQSAVANKYANHSPTEIIIALSKATMSQFSGPLNTLITKADRFDLIKEDYKTSGKDTISYWKNRFSAIDASVRIFGINEAQAAKTVTDIKSGNFDTQQTGKSIETEPIANLKRVTNIDNSGKLPYYPLDDELFAAVLPFHTIFTSTSNAMETVKDNNLAIANMIKDKIGWEFYMDTTGEIVFKPPFYNMDSRSNYPISHINDIDIINWNVTENINEIYTRVDVTGSPYPGFESGSGGLNPYNFYIDWNLAKTYGIKSAQPISRDYLFNDVMCYIYAVQHLSLLNSKRFSGTIEIAGRPEIRLGYPIYVQSMYTFFYVTGVSHSFTFGGTFTTQLTIEGARRVYVPPSFAFVNDNGSSKQTLLNGSYTSGANIVTEGSINGNFIDISIKEDKNNFMVYPNVVLDFSEQFKSSAKINPVKGGYLITETYRPGSYHELGKKLSSDLGPILDEVLSETDATTDGKKVKKYTGDKIQTEVINRFASRLKGKGSYLKDLEGKSGMSLSGLGLNDIIRRYITQVGNVNVTISPTFKLVSKPGVFYADPTVGIPVSDEKGYELIGGFPYGRGLYFDNKKWVNDNIKKSEGGIDINKKIDSLEKTGNLFSISRKKMEELDKEILLGKSKASFIMSGEDFGEAGRFVGDFNVLNPLPTAATYILSVSPSNVGVNIEKMFPSGKVSSKCKYPHTS